MIKNKWVLLIPSLTWAVWKPSTMKQTFLFIFEWCHDYSNQNVYIYPTDMSPSIQLHLCFLTSHRLLCVSWFEKSVIYDMQVGMRYKIMSFQEEYDWRAYQRFKSSNMSSDRYWYWCVILWQTQPWIKKITGHKDCQWQLSLGPKWSQKQSVECTIRYEIMHINSGSRASWRLWIWVLRN